MRHFNVLCVWQTNYPIKTVIRISWQNIYKSIYKKSIYVQYNNRFQGISDVLFEIFLDVHTENKSFIINVTLNIYLLPAEVGLLNLAQAWAVLIHFCHRSFATTFFNRSFLFRLDCFSNTRSNTIWFSNFRLLSFGGRDSNSSSAIAYQRNKKMFTID